MFDDLMGMMGKLQAAQAKVEETKKRLDTVLIDSKSRDGQLSVTVTANGNLKAISLDDQLLEDKEQLEDYLIMTINEALSKATVIREAELGHAAKDGMPDIPGMDFLK